MGSPRLHRLAGVLLLGVTVAACGSPGTSSTAPPSSSGTTATEVAAVANEVPAAVRAKGTLIVAADATYAPNEFIGSDGKTVVGMDADLATALGQVMGLKVTVENVTFDDIIPGIKAGKYDVGMSSFTDTKEREQVVDFVTYFNAGTSFIIKKGGAAVGSLSDLCGHTVAVEKGTTQESDATDQTAKCTSAGKPGVTVLSYPDQNAANLALQSGRAEIGMADSPVADYAVKQSNGQFQISGQAYGTAPYGIALPKGNGMATVVRDALNELIKSGVYANILKQWGLDDGAISNPGINQGS